MKKLALIVTLLLPFSMGTLLSVGHAATDRSYQVQTHQISKKEAKEIALKKVKGEFVSIELETDDGREHYEVKIKNAGTMYEVEIDAKTGKVLEVEKEGAHDDDGGRDDDGQHDDDGHLDD